MPPESCSAHLQGLLAAEGQPQVLASAQPLHEASLTAVLPRASIRLAYPEFFMQHGIVFVEILPIVAPARSEPRPACEEALLEVSLVHTDMAELPAHALLPSLQTSFTAYCACGSHLPHICMTAKVEREYKHEHVVRMLPFKCSFHCVVHRIAAQLCNAIVNGPTSSCSGVAPAGRTAVCSSNICSHFVRCLQAHQ